ncbi:hypothetical protein A2U01_0064235 [Trifolium medium]|uniref:Uncharacterized protein n=1 Tax=Trifolium medium TaxID=97028 RepID=A0A392S2A9_9FABA|nr:hypothetical protein [Trifolium medium]
MPRNQGQPEYRPDDPMLNFSIHDFDLDDVPLHMQNFDPIGQASGSSGGR